VLILTRGPAERVRLLLPDGTALWVTVLETRNAKVRLGFDAPQGVRIDREEILPPLTALPRPPAPG
jgi:carbon storage regulator CsrA